ncbi:MAG: STAS domain-containing protein [Stygiobacter sp.]|jgi:anti-anti-sigma factor|uniref:Anti-sigma factor antagonist n=1 Tax=Stygiobacter electus TaxID=3032292 RepID=A0AAE3TC36_9BACT|nr:STAS domain-containing protein [Stygiobacter electus]MDF1612013.1 STAS domain-containing protein [Stygiobacter electus]
MEIIEEVIDDIVVEIINLDRATLREAEDLKDKTTSKLNAGFNKFIIDLSNVEFIDSTFLGVIVGTLKKAVKNGGDLKLIGFQPNVRAMFELTRLFRVFETYPELQEAIRSFYKK